jgi:hypothetical protein
MTDPLAHQQLQGAVPAHRNQQPAALCDSRPHFRSEFLSGPRFNESHGKAVPCELRSCIRNFASRFAAAGTRIHENCHVRGFGFHCCM